MPGVCSKCMLGSSWNQITTLTLVDQKNRFQLVFCRISSLQKEPNFEKKNIWRKDGRIVVRLNIDGHIGILVFDN